MRNKVLVATASLIIILIVGWGVSAPLLSRIARERIISALEENFASRLDVKTLDVSVFPRVAVLGEGLTFHLRDRPEVPPLFTIRKFTVRVTPAGALEIETLATEPTAPVADSSEWDAE